MKKNNGFGLGSIIIIIIITALVSSISTGVIMLNNASDEINGSLGSLTDDDNLKEFIKVYNTLVSKYYDEIDKEGMLNAAEEGMLNFLGDKYTTYLDDEQYNEIMDELSGTYTGIGVAVLGNEIKEVTKNSPAEKAGILAGDFIVSINGTNVEDKDQSEIVSLIKNDDVKEVKLEIRRKEEILNFTLVKEVLINTTVKGQVIEGTNIGYITIKTFAKNLKDQVEIALNELEKKNITSLIIDVRNNVGGYLSSAEEVSSMFLEEGKTIYSLESTNSSKYTYTDKTKEKRTYPIIVLINKNSASASEILAAALQESYGAKLVGTQSYGKGKVQQVVSLNSGDSVKYTSAKWLTPNGVCIDGVGLTPDYQVSYDVGEEYDTQLQKAIDLLKNK